jgi:hypothetical protein
MRKWLAMLVGVAMAAGAAAQSPMMFKTRLSTVAMDAAMKATIAGQGSATAALTGTKLTVTGHGGAPSSGNRDWRAGS